MQIIVLLFLLYLGYILFIKGKAWPILLAVFGYLGGYTIISGHFPATKAPFIKIIGHDVSIASGISGLIVLLGFAVIMGNYDDE